MSLKNSRIEPLKLLDAVAATGPGDSVDVSKQIDFNQIKSFQAVADGSAGAFSATIDVEVSNDDTNWIVMGTITLSGTAGTADADGFTSNAAWKYARGNVTAISGTGANTTLTMGD